MSNGFHSLLCEHDVVARINRYSQLRSAERALSPSVRRRVSLAAARPRQGLLRHLQQLLDSIYRAETGGREAQLYQPAIGSVDRELDALASQLASAVRQTPLATFRTTLPDVVGSHRTDAVALLDFWLDSMDRVGDPMYLVDYLITLLSTDEVDGRVTLVCDPTSVSDGVGRACLRQADAGATPDEADLREASEMLRESSVHLLRQSDLEETIVAMRALKARVGTCFFDRDFLRSVVQYNATVKNRFADLASTGPERDGTIERTLAALRALDLSGSVAAASG